jgi:predicted aminopeptidase
LLWARYLERRKRGDEVRSHLAKAYRELDELYRSGRNELEKRQEKSRILDALKAKTGIRRDLNNASLIQYKTYDPSDQGFRELLERYRGEVPAFLKRLSRLTDSDFGGPQREDVRAVLESIRD